MERRNPRHDARFLRYRMQLFRHIAPASRGLEIGAFDLPMVSDAEAQVEFLDYFSTRELRARAARSPGHSEEFVAPVNYVLRDIGWGAIAESW